MPIDATAPTTVSATYDRWTLSALTIYGDGCAAAGETDVRPTVVKATMVKYRQRDDGLYERSPLASDQVELTVDDLYAAAASNPALAAAIPAIVAAIESVGGGRF